MTIELTWIANSTVSWLHAAEAIISGQTIVDASLADALAEPAQSLKRTLDGLGVEPSQFFRHATPLARHAGSDRQWAEGALRKTLGPATSDSMVAAGAACLAELKRAGALVQPKLLDELALRAGPIREHWEARGPGLLAGVARRTDPGVVVESATVLVVHPICGGAGKSHPAVNSVRIEAVLANPRPELPEVVRLAWLLATLSTDLPRFTDRPKARPLTDVTMRKIPAVTPVFWQPLRSSRRFEIPSLALIPAVLDAAADVELVQPKPDLLTTALGLWSCSPVDADRLATPLGQWWRTYLGTRLDWPVALVALERMVEDAGGVVE